MPTTTEIEARLRGYAEQYDQEFPSTARAESRTMARIAITPRPLARVTEPGRKWAPAIARVRSLAIAWLVLIAVGALAIGVSRLRSAQRHSVPSIGVPGKLEVYPTGMEFISADEGWIAETRSSLSLAGPTVLFRTTDGGLTWQNQLTWDGPGPSPIRLGPDRVQGLGGGGGRVPLFTTGDGGAHWQRQQIPSQLRSADLIYFLDAREGWIVGYLNETTPGFAGVFHTTDGAQHWTQTARLDVGQVFSYGQRGGSLQASLMFHDSSTGWLNPGTISGTGIPVVEPHLYMTHATGRISRTTLAEFRRSSIVCNAPKCSEDCTWCVLFWVRLFVAGCHLYVSPDPAQALYYYAAVAFLVGFSERLVPGILRSAERRFNSSRTKSVESKSGSRPAG